MASSDVSETSNKFDTDASSVNTSNSSIALEAISLTKQVANLNPEKNEPLIILDDISFSISKGQTIAIVGPSGSGKSTLLGLLAGLDAPSKGTVLVNEEDIFSLDEDGRASVRAKTMGFVFQSFHLLPALTALENVMLPMEIIGVDGARDAALSVLGRVGLADRLEHYPSQLSGGEQQRVAIARAFAPRPALLLADEPTGNLDTKTGQQTIELLFELNAEQSTTLVLVTHDHSLAEKCDRVISIEAGKLKSEQ